MGKICSNFWFIFIFWKNWRCQKVFLKVTDFQKLLCFLSILPFSIFPTICWFQTKLKISFQRLPYLILIFQAFFEKIVKNRSWRIPKRILKRVLKRILKWFWKGLWEWFWKGFWKGFWRGFWTGFLNNFEKDSERDT